MIVTLETGDGYRIDCPEQPVISLGRRDPANHKQIDIDLSQPGNGVSRLHAFIYIRDDGVFVEDFNSRNGTFLNQYQLIPLRPYPLKDGDILKPGRIELRVHIGTQAKASI